MLPLMHCALASVPPRQVERKGQRTGSGLTAGYASHVSSSTKKPFRTLRWLLSSQWRPVVQSRQRVWLLRHCSVPSGHGLHTANCPSVNEWVPGGHASHPDGSASLRSVFFMPGGQWAGWNHHGTDGGGGEGGELGGAGGGSIGGGSGGAGGRGGPGGGDGGLGRSGGLGGGGGGP